MVMERKEEYMKPLVQARQCPPTVVYTAAPPARQLPDDTAATARHSRAPEHKMEGFWVKGPVSGNRDLVARAADLTQARAKIKELLSRQPAVLVQPHVRELACLQYRVLFDPFKTLASAFGIALHQYCT